MASLPGSKYGALYYRELDKNKQHGITQSKYNYEAYVELFHEHDSIKMVARKTFLVCLIKKNEDPPSVTIYSDASDNASGAHFQVTNTRGNWSLQEISYYINVKEMLLVFFALKCFAKQSSNLKVKMYIDNTSLVSIFKNMSTPLNNF